MKQTIHISMGGFAFILEEDAYAALKVYTETIRNYFKNKNGGNEVVDDIETRIAEIFKERLQGKEVVMLEDVQYMISIMGEPEVYMDGENTEETSQENNQKMNEEEQPKRLFRDPDHKVIAGVCGGAAAYLNIDPIWFRLAFAVAFFFYGTGTLLYIILWIAIPKAKTRAEKLQMKGKKVNLANFEESIKEDLKSFGENAEKFAKGPEAKRTVRNVSSFIEELVSRILGIILKILKAVLKVASAIVIFFSIVFFVGLIIALFTGGRNIHFGKNVHIGLGGSNDIIDFIFTSSEHSYMMFFGLFLFLGVPTIALIFQAVRYLANIKKTNRIFSLTALTLWLIGFALCIYSGIELGQNFSEKNSGKTTEIIPFDSHRILTLSGPAERTSGGTDTDDNGNLIVNDVHLDIVSARPDSVIKLQIIKISRGKDEDEASRNQKLIDYHPVLTDSNLTFSDHFIIQKGNRYRSQEVNVKLFIPEGQRVYFDKSLAPLLYDVDNVHNLHDSEMPKHLWEMTKEGLTCLDCPASLIKNDSDTLDNK